MRTAFIQELIVQARIHPDIFLVVGDLGYSVVEPFAAEFPDRFLNAGVAEQNMTGVAAGLASEGWHVFTYSIANFPTLRCFEQIRNDIAYHNLPVTVCSVGAGLAYGSLGYSHHAVQDIAVIRSLPQMTVLSPADPGETRESVQWLAKNPCPSYIRLGKAGESILHDTRGICDGPICVMNGDADCAIVATGSILSVAQEAAELMVSEGRRIAVFSCPWLQPCGREFFQTLEQYRLLFVLEEHLAAGGFGSLLRESLPHATEIVSLAIPATVMTEVGSQSFLRNRAGLNSAALAARLRKHFL